MKNEFFIIGGVLYIVAISKGDRHEIKADAEDFNTLDSFGSWSVSHHPKSKGLVAVSRTSEKKTVYMHRVVTAAPRGLEVDHINRLTLDNRKSNLRFVTSSENKQNRNDLPNHNTSGVRGVQWSKQKEKWAVALVISGKRMHGGFFVNLTEAEKRAKELRAMYAPFSPEASENPLLARDDLSEFYNPVRSDNKTGIPGVSLRNGKYRVRIHDGGKEKFIGTFNTIEEAAEAVKKARESRQ